MEFIFVRTAQELLLVVVVLQGPIDVMTTTPPIHEPLPHSVVRDALLWGSLCALGVSLAYIMLNLKPVQLPEKVKSDANDNPSSSSASGSIEIDVESASSPGPPGPAASAPMKEFALLSNDLAPEW